MPAPAGRDALAGRRAPNVCALVEETRWPIAAGTVDRLIVAHGLETCERPDALLDEIWRVLAPGGRAVFIVPNRSGLWARRDATPFGYGRPYSFGQLESLLRKHRFMPRAPRRRALRAALAPQVLAADGASLGAHRAPLRPAARGRRAARRGLQAGLRPPARRPGSKVAVPGPLEVLEGLAGPKPEPVGGDGRADALPPRGAADPGR